MYDESGALFCPVLKKCHCTNCIRVIKSVSIRNNGGDDDSDDSDDVGVRLYSNGNEFSHLYGTHPRQVSYRTN